MATDLTDFINIINAKLPIRSTKNDGKLRHGSEAWQRQRDFVANTLDRFGNGEASIVDLGKSLLPPTGIGGRLGLSNPDKNRIYEAYGIANSQIMDDGLHSGGIKHKYYDNITLPAGMTVEDAIARAENHGTFQPTRDWTYPSQNAYNYDLYPKSEWENKPIFNVGFDHVQELRDKENIKNKQFKNALANSIAGLTHNTGIK